MGKPADVQLQAISEETKGRTPTVHTTTVRRYLPLGPSVAKHRPPAEPEEEHEDDRLADEILRQTVLV